MEKKAQAAMEFLMTYGWAILAAIIAIGVLAWFGVFSPGRFVSSSCTLNAPLGCDEYTINVTGANLVLRNGQGDQINIINVSVQGCGSSTVGNVADGDTKLVFINCSQALIANSRFKGAITVTYMRNQGQINLTSSGQITGTVAAS